MSDRLEERIDNVAAYMEKMESRIDRLANMHSDAAETRCVLANCVDELDSRLGGVEEVLGALMPDEQPARVAELEAEVERLRGALREISKGEGTFSRDPLEHAENVIENQVDIAERALNNDTDQ